MSYFRQIRKDLHKYNNPSCLSGTKAQFREYLSSSQIAKRTNFHGAAEKKLNKLIKILYKQTITVRNHYYKLSMKNDYVIIWK